jgi:hypothetical protein
MVIRRGFSSRKLERAIYDSVAFRFIAANDHPDHDDRDVSAALLEEIEKLMRTIENPRRGEAAQRAFSPPSRRLFSTTLQ